MSVQEHLTHVQARIAEAARAVGRDPASISLIAVSKTKPVAMIREALEAGQLDFGENKVQEMQDKAPELPERVHWHAIGHLQRNKVKYLAPFVHLIHSVDSQRLLKEINKQAGKHERIIDCLLQLNISEEDAKFGLDEQAARQLLEQLDAFPHVRIKGLMGMAAFSEDEQLVRGQFARLRRAFEEFSSFSHERIQMQELSMGMSGDYAWAIAEGSTMVRIGSAIFGARH